MRKVYTIILALLITGGSSYAQRNIDWSVEEFITPTEIASNTTTGTSFNVEAVLKNNGPASVVAGDSILYQLAMLSENNAVILAVPSASSFGVRIAANSMTTGDTMHFHLRFTIGNYPINSLNVKLRLASQILNRGADSVANELTADLVNNILVKNMVWWNPQKFGVGIDEVSTSFLMDMQPNPAVDQLVINYKMANAKVANTIAIYDMQGRVAFERTSPLRTNSESIDLSGFANGLYTVRVKAGDIESHQKLQVIH